MPHNRASRAVCAPSAWRRRSLGGPARLAATIASSSSLRACSLDVWSSTFIYPPDAIHLSARSIFVTCASLRVLFLSAKVRFTVLRRLKMLPWLRDARRRQRLAVRLLPPRPALPDHGLRMRVGRPTHDHAPPSPSCHMHTAPHPPTPPEKQPPPPPEPIRPRPDS